MQVQTPKVDASNLLISKPNQKNYGDTSTRASEVQRSTADQVSILEKISMKISQKPKTAVQKTRYAVRDSIVDADASSAWGKIATEMVETEATRTLDLSQKMDRRRMIDREQVFRRGCYASTTQPHPFAVSQKELDEKGDENVSFPWESREESFK